MSGHFVIYSPSAKENSVFKVRKLDLHLSLNIIQVRELMNNSRTARHGKSPVNGYHYPVHNSLCLAFDPKWPICEY